MTPDPDRHNQDFDDIAEAGLLHMPLDPVLRAMLGAMRAELAMADENTGDFNHSYLAIVFNHSYLAIVRRCDSAGYFLEAA